MKRSAFLLVLVVACDFPQLPDVMPPPGSPKDITKFSFKSADNPQLPAEVVATITDTQITATLPLEVSATELKASFVTSPGATVAIDGNPQMSEVTSNDFTQPLTYTVTGADGSTKDYTVSIRVPKFVLSMSSITTGTSPSAIAVADLNNDGLPDLIVANGGSSSFSVLINTTGPGSAMPTFAGKVDFDASTGAGVAAADLNGDGKPDVAVANNGTNAVSLHLDTTPDGGTTASFAPEVSLTLASNTSPHVILVADFNGDGLPDLAVSDASACGATVLINTTPPDATMPSFAPGARFSIGCGTNTLGVADVNADGKPDLIQVVNSTVLVLPNTTTTGATTPVFSSNTTFQLAISAPTFVTAADINNDGKPDLIIAGSNGASTHVVSVLLNTFSTGAPSPSFAAHADFTTGVGPSAIAVADLDSDGTLDVVVANSTANTVSILPNSTATAAMAPSFAPNIDLPAGTGPSAVAIADFNGDGLPDIAVANSGANSVSILVAQ